MSNDWMPGKRDAQLAMAKGWLELLPGKIALWNIPQEMVLLMRELTAVAEAARNKAYSPGGTMADTANERMAFAALKSQMRNIKRRYFLMPPLYKEDFAALGLRPPDTVRMQHTSVTEEVEFVIHLRGIRELVVDFWVRGHARKAKPAGYGGAVIVWGPRGARPAQSADLPNHTLATKTPHTLLFDESDRGKTVYMALAWQNRRGIQGQWSDFKSAVVP
jgi:hypothetical protein